ncbi:hypothetical protein MKX03_014030 [Papaver bracteatum]|nr:hypothetical protein MKX03_014030 [Papaver bracteatum]
MNTDTKNASFYVLFFVFLLCNKPLNSIAANDTISTGQTLGGTETITSKNGNFVMGFFRPGKSQWYYIGIWYNNDMVSVQTIVWVANRDKPLRNIVVSGLHLSENGDLVIYDYDPYEVLIWSTNTSSIGSNTTEAVLGDDGNLVIRDKSNSSVVYWQSFDYPTDTWLPGGKMNVNKLLTSWRNQEDPASGIFKLEFRQPDYFKYHIVTFRSQHTENWDIGESFQQANSVHNFSYISNENGSYLTYNLNSSLMLSRFVLDVSGQIKQFILSDTTKSWNLFWSKPQQLCDVYGVCGPFGNCNQDTQKCDCWRGFSNKSPAEWNLGDSTGGCQRNTPLQCGSEDDFSPIPTSKLPDYSQSRQVNRTEDCITDSTIFLRSNAILIDSEIMVQCGCILVSPRVPPAASVAMFSGTFASVLLNGLEELKGVTFTQTYSVWSLQKHIFAGQHCRRQTNTKMT